MSTGSTPSNLFTPEHWQQVEQILRTLTEQQAQWLGNHLGSESKDAPAPSSSAARIAIVHGGETGNGEGVAKKLSDRLQLAGLPAKIEDMARLKVRQLSRYDYIAAICSTHGDGDPPEPTLAFFEALLADNAPKLEHLHFSVLALGDSSYEHFCVAGKQLDERFEALGATRMLARVDCDVDFEQPARQWGQALLDTLSTQIIPVTGGARPVQAEQEKVVTFSKQSPLAVEVLENICLSDAKRDAPVHHLELAMEEEGFVVVPGDAVGVLPENPPELIATILDATQLSAEDAVTVGESAMALVQALRQHVDLTVAGPRFLEYWAPLSGSAELQEIAAETAGARAYLKTRQLRDIVTLYPADATPQEFVDRLRPLQPRLYDVANSLRTVEGELHITVQAYRYPFAGRTESGIATQYLLGLQPGDVLRLYPHRNARFHLPEDPNVPLVLVADGTGIAPYRAFLQELANSERGSRCWLVFSERRFEDDFLYQIDLQQARENGVLEHVDGVFHEDHPEATLAGAIAANQERFRQWLGQGAHLYLCGDKERLNACEKQLQQMMSGADEQAWSQLVTDKRIHRNLY